MLSTPSGTSDTDGQCLLTATLHSLASRGPESPFVLATTHFHNVKALLGGPNLPVVYNTFEYVYNGPDIVFLYKLKPGSSSTSQAHQVAKLAGNGFIKLSGTRSSPSLNLEIYAVGIDEDVIERSFDINTCITQGEEILLTVSYTHLTLPTTPYV